ncbi:MAG: hypothetical protein QM757_31335 [Paludibaculum sp.]
MAEVPALDRAQGDERERIKLAPSGHVVDVLVFLKLLQRFRRFRTPNAVGIDVVSLLGQGLLDLADAILAGCCWVVRLGATVRRAEAVPFFDEPYREAADLVAPPFVAGALLVADFEGAALAVVPLPAGALVTGAFAGAFFCAREKSGKLKERSNANGINSRRGGFTIEG